MEQASGHLFEGSTEQSLIPKQIHLNYRWCPPATLLIPKSYPVSQSELGHIKMSTDSSALKSSNLSDELSHVSTLVLPCLFIISPHTAHTPSSKWTASVLASWLMREFLTILQDINFTAIIFGTRRNISEQHKITVPQVSMRRTSFIFSLFYYCSTMNLFML